MSDTAPTLGSIALFALLAVAMLLVGAKRGFFQGFPTQTWRVPVQLKQVGIAFLIYFGSSFFIIPFLSQLLRPLLYPTPSPAAFLAYGTWLNFLNSLLILLGLIWLARSILPVFRQIWRRSDTPAYIDDARFALFAWLVAFPLVLFIGQILDWGVISFFHIHEIPEQLAVRFLKMTFDYPFYMLLTILTIIFFAPLIEETLFRGYLQSYMRQHVGPKQAVGLTSFLFAFFHYSPQQGLANIPILGSLFILALFLGFIYEKRGSLFASISLHACFNLISVINLYFLGGFPNGPI